MQPSSSCVVINFYIFYSDEDDSFLQKLVVNHEGKYYFEENGRLLAKFKKNKVKGNVS